MALEVTIYQIPGHPRSKAVTCAMLEGILKTGDNAKLRSALAYRRPEGDVAVFYGLAGNLARALADYPAAGKKAVYVDLGYWGRKDGGRFNGYHKVSVNGRHPTEYFQQHKHSADRSGVFGLHAAPWSRAGGHILLAGMGPKGSRAEGFSPLAWERRALAMIRQYTDRPIIYRPKPNWENPLPFADVITAPKDQPLMQALAGCHAVVAHHSNAAVEALVAGVPAFVVEGIALPMGSADLSSIEKPRYPTGRPQWLADAAYAQWSVTEMASGAAWRHLKDEGLV